MGTVTMGVNGLFGFPAGISTVVAMTAFITGYFFNIFNTHATGKKSYGDEETDDENGDHHQDPCDRFKSAETEGLKNPSTEESNRTPPCYRPKGTKKEVI